MPVRPVVLFGLGLVGVVALHQLNEDLGSLAFIALVGTLIIHALNLVVGPIAPPVQALPAREVSSSTFPLSLVISDLPLLVELTVTTEGENREELLERFTSTEYWRASVHSALRVFDSKDALVIEHAIRRAVNDRVDWFNSIVAGRPEGSHLFVLVEKPVIEWGASHATELRPLGSDLTA